MLNPDAHVVFSANHLPVGSWYPYDLGLVGSIGQGPRAMRLRQLLAGDRVFSVEDFEAVIHRDNVNPAVAALWPVAHQVVREDGISDELVLGVVEALQDWDLHYDSNDPAYPTAMALSDCAVQAFRRTDLMDSLSGGWSGVCRLANLLSGRFTEDGATPRDPVVRNYLVEWLRVTGAQVVDSGRPLGRQAEPVPHTRRMPYQASERIDFPSANPELDTVSPPVTCGQTQTVWSQIGNAYTQIVDLSDIDNSRTVLPPGVSEDPDSPFYLNQMDLWLRGTTHPAPLSRGKVEAIAASQRTLSTWPYEGADAPAERVVNTVPEDARLVAAIPPASAAAAAQSGEMPQSLADEMYPR
jgi:penicillin amidase